MKLHFITLLALTFGLNVNGNVNGFRAKFRNKKILDKKLGMFVETYWESWVKKDYPEDYCANMRDVPATPIGSTSGANIINIAFADYSGGLNGIESNISNVVEGIEAVHNAGGLVKVAYGGALFSMSSAVSDEATAEQFCDSVVEMRNTHNVDGIDLDIEDGGTSAKLQTHLLKSCRTKLGPDFLITYTFPATAELVEPWHSTLLNGNKYLDYINIMAYDVYWSGYDVAADIEALQGLGIPKRKIVYGLMPGHHDASNEYTSLEDARDAALFAKEEGLGGVMTWDINRDCDQRMNYPHGQDNLYQTGKPQAAFVDLLSRTLNL